MQLAGPRARDVEHGARARDPVGRPDEALDGPHDEPREREVREDEEREREGHHVQRHEPDERRGPVRVVVRAKPRDDRAGPLGDDDLEGAPGRAVNRRH